MTHKKSLIGITVLSICAFLFALSASRWNRHSSPVSAAASVNYPREVARVTFAAAGDVIPHQAVVQAAAAQSHLTPASASPSADPKDASSSSEGVDNHAGWDNLLANVSEVFRQADFGFVNLETPVAPIHSRGSKPFQFDAPIPLLQSLKSNGIKIVSFANNHVFDQGHVGFFESLDHLREQGLLFTGAGANADQAWKPVILEKNGIKVGWLGMTRWLNGNRNPEKNTDPHVAFFPYPDQADGAPGRDEAGVLEAVKAARGECDLLIVSIHWGIEYATAPNPQDVDIAHDMLEAGASAVIGHHPHVLQPIETYLTKDKRNTVIFFSLGNFLSNQSRNYVSGLTPDKAGEQRDSLIIKFSVVKKDYGPAGNRFELADMGILPVWTENNHLLVKGGHARALFIGPVFMDREIPKLQARYDELDHLGPQLSPEQKQELVQVSSRLQMLKHRRELLLLRTGDDFLIAPPSP
jgi:poly-gamma-glutamate capsule biosynthesis protein CapA/YwtB (metallophosphatase superfamily)